LNKDIKFAGGINMSWWQKIIENIREGEELFTPGRGVEGNHRKPFWVRQRNNGMIVVESGNTFIPLEKQCFDAIESALTEGRYPRLRIASLRQREPYHDSADRLIRDATGNNLARGNYVCAILIKIGVVYYVMQGRQKCIALPPDHNSEHPENRKNYKITIIIEKDNHGYYAFCPDLEGCQSQGDTLEEVLANIREAVELYLETLSNEEMKTSLSKEILTTSMEVQVG
jgi:predicted RNase H-like HicB family nuclease